MAGTGGQRGDRRADVRAERIVVVGRVKPSDYEHAVRMSPMHGRSLTILGALIVGAMFVAGLFIHGRVGGLLLLITTVVLALVTSAVWPQLPARHRTPRLVIIAVVAVLALVKLIAG